MRLVPSSANRASVAVPVPASAGAGAPHVSRRRHRAVRVALWVLRVVSTLSLVLAVVAVVAFAIGPRTGLWRTVTILTGSMVPTFAPGDVIISTPMPTTELREG